MISIVITASLIFQFFNACSGCSTIAAGRLATVDGSVIVSHSNDGDGDVAGNIHVVPRAAYAPNSMRTVSGGSIPQVPFTHQYFTEGYAIANEHQVVLGESTCSARFEGNVSAGAMLNIVDLGQLGLERSSTAREAVRIMGDLATSYGYYDAGESLFVGDTEEVWVFHILPDETGRSAIWGAQRIPDDHVSTVMNAFIIRDMDLSNPAHFMFSENIRRYTDGSNTIDFTAAFTGPNEAKCKYSSGRRMWAVYNTVAPSLHVPSHYADLVTSRPYPVSAKPDVPTDVSGVTAMMRIYYRDTQFDMRVVPALSGGAFATPSRWVTDQLVNGESVCWERPIATFRSIVSFVGQMRSSERTGVIWFAPHSTLTSQYAPFVTSMKELPEGYTSNNMAELGRGWSAYWAFKYLHNIMQMRSWDILRDIESLQRETEATNFDLVRELTDQQVDPATAQFRLNRNARDLVSRFWTFSDTMVMKYSDGYCNFDCGEDQPYHLGYRQEWLNQILL